MPDDLNTQVQTDFLLISTRTNVYTNCDFIGLHVIEPVKVSKALVIPLS